MFSSDSSDYIFGKFADFAPHLSPELDRFCTHILLQTLVPTSFQDTSDPNVAASATGGRNVGSIENNDVENIVMKAPGGVIQILNMTSHDIPWYPNFPNSQVTVLIYYWDDRDGSSFSGWWIGPKVGGDQVWSHADNRTTTRGVKRAVFLLMKPWQCWIHVSISQIYKTL